jgi:PKD repeat protein
MNRDTLFFGLTVAVLMLSTGLVIVPMLQSDADDSDVNTFSGTVSELWPDEDVGEYAISGPVRISIVPDDANGFHYSIFKTSLHTFNLEVVDGAIDSIVWEPGYVNIILIKSDGSAVVDARTICLKVASSSDDSMNYGDEHHVFDEYVSLSPASRSILVGDTYTITAQYFNPNDPDHPDFYYHVTHWRSLDNIVSVTPSSDAYLSSTATVLGLEGGSTQIELQLGYAWYDDELGLYTPGYCYAYSDVTVTAPTYTLTLNYAANPTIPEGLAQSNLPESSSITSTSNTFNIQIPNNIVTVNDSSSSSYILHREFRGYSLFENDSAPMYEPGETYEFNAGTKTLYPIFEKQYTYIFRINYSANGASNVPGYYSAQDPSSSITIQIPTAKPVKSGYTFFYWTEEGNQYSPGSTATFTSGTHTLTAYFVPNFTVTIQSNDDSLGTVSRSTVTAPSGTQYSASGKTLTIGSISVTATEAAGCSFVGWSSTRGTISDDTAITANFQGSTPMYNVGIKLANWGSFTVTYNGSTTTYTSDTTLALEGGKTLDVDWLGKPTWIENDTYYTRTTTYTSACANMSGTEYGSSLGNAVTVNSDKTFYPAEQMTSSESYTGVKYYLVFDANGGTGAPSQLYETNNPASLSSTVTFNIPGTTPRMDHYNFMGWSTDPDATAADYQSGGTISVSYGQTTLYAVWQTSKKAIFISCDDWEYFTVKINGVLDPTHYTDDLTFYLDIGDRFDVDWYGPGPVNTSGNGWQCTTTYPVCTKMSKGFHDPTDLTDYITVSQSSESWYFPENSKARMAVNNYTMTYTLNFDANGGAGAPTPETVTKTDTTLSRTVIHIPSVKPVMGSVKFLGWVEYESSNVPEYLPNNDYEFSWGVHNLKALWEFDTSGFIVNLIIDGETVRLAVPESNPYITYEAPAKAGKRFVGWSDGQQLFDTTRPVTNNMTLYAMYEPTNSTSPIADATITRVAANEYLFSSSASSNVDHVLWEFGDGGTSTERNPIHTYTSTGTYIVKLTVYNSNGTESDTNIQMIVVEQQGGASGIFEKFKNIPAKYIIIGIIAILALAVVVRRVI